MWKEYYKEYKEEIYLHIIIDNCSESKYIKMVEGYFKQSVILHRDRNGGVTAAYNAGIKYILENSEADAILLIDSDIKMPKGSISKLYTYLFSVNNLGFAAPILMKKNETVVENFGCKISKNLKYIHLYKGTRLEDVEKDAHFVDGVPGGINMAKTELYKKIGLEDEALFMYADEMDMAIRAKQGGYRLGATKRSLAWHQHENINFAGNRLPYVYYLSSRNVIYIALKYYGRKKALIVFASRFILNFGWIISKLIKLQFHNLKMPAYSIMGLLFGVRGDMSENKYSKPRLTRSIENES